MPLTLAETPLYYKDSQGQYHRIMSGADMTGYRTAAAQDAIDAAQNTRLSTIESTEVVVVNIGSYSGAQVRVPASGTNSAITANHVLLAWNLGTPANQSADWTVTTYNGYLTLSGSASAATSVQLILGKSGTTI